MLATMLAAGFAGVLFGAAATAWILRAQLREARAHRERALLAEQRVADLQHQAEALTAQAKGLNESLTQQLQSLLPGIADAVLARKTEQLENSARQSLRFIQQETVNQVQISNVEMKAALETMRDQITGYQQRIQQMEAERAAAAGRLEQQLQQVASTGASLSHETRALREALRTGTVVRGRWGENVLRNILEACGLNEFVDYDLQTVLAGEDGGALRPDAIVHLPSGRDLILDSKASLDDFMAGLEEGEEAGRRDRFKQFAQVLRRRATELAGKDYSRNLKNSIPCVVMFVPSEAAFRAAMDADPDLYRYGQEKRPSIVLASPSTLFPLLAVIAQGWRQHDLDRQAQQLNAEVNEFAKRLEVFLRHLQKVADGLDDAGKAYNSALASFRSRLAPQMERLRQMKAEFPDPTQLRSVEQRPLLPESPVEAETPAALAAEDE